VAAADMLYEAVGSLTTAAFRVKGMATRYPRSCYMVGAGLGRGSSSAAGDNLPTWLFM
jgi:hypothetical protein